MPCRVFVAFCPQHGESLGIGVKFLIFKAFKRYGVLREGAALRSLQDWVLVPASVCSPTFKDFVEEKRFIFIYISINELTLIISIIEESSSRL